MKSEREAYDRAMDLLSTLDVRMDTIRLDMYYSSPSYMDNLGDTKVFVIPKKNATLNGSKKWKDSMRDFVENIMPYLEQYRKRSNSESGFAAERCLDGMWLKKREHRIDNALFCTGVWHNMFNIGRSWNSVPHPWYMLTISIILILLTCFL
jgi:transposase